MDRIGRRRLIRPALAFVCAVLTGSVAQASGLYGITVLDPGGSQGFLSTAYLNDQGQVAGNLINVKGAATGTDVGYYYDSQNGGNVTLLNAPQVGATKTSAQGYSASFGPLNNTGTLLGWSDSLSDTARTTISYQNGQAVPIQVPGTVQAVNDSGQILSLATDRTINKFGYSDAFLTTNGVTRELTLPAGTSGFYGITMVMNNAGQIASSTAIPTADGPLGLVPGQSHAYLMTGSVWTDLGTLGGSYASPMAINKNGDVVGFSATPGDKNYQAFVVPFGKPMVELNTIPGAINSAANGINDKGQIVGEVDTTNVSPSGAHAFVYTNGKMIELDQLLPANSGWHLTDAIAINNQGQILSYGVGPDGEFHDVLLTLDSQPAPPTPVFPAPLSPVPTPEPAAIAGFAVLAAALGFRSARFRTDR